VTPPDYEYCANLLRDHSGLDLSADKQYLIESRLLPLARKAGLPGISELVQKNEKVDSASVTTQVVEAMTTNETFFFPRQGSVRSFPRFDHARNPEGARKPQEHPDLVRRRLDRSGTLFAGDVP